MLKKKLKNILMAGAALGISSAAAMAQTTPTGDLVDGAVSQIETILPAMTPLFLAGIGLTVGFVVYRKVRKGINGA